MKERFDIRCLLFEDYALRARQGYIAAPPFGVRYPCPCCGYPTLKERRDDEVCLLCLWEDDGRDDSDDSVGVGTSELSLALARSNFELYGTIYSPDQVMPGEAADQTPLEQELKRATIEAFDTMLDETDHAALKMLWKRLHAGEQVIEHELRRRGGRRLKRLSY